MDRAESSAITVAVRVKPGARREYVGGNHVGPRGAALVISVTAKAVDGAATEAVRRALAAALGVRPATVELKSGRASKDKLFTIVSAPPDLGERVTRLLAAVPRGVTTT